MEYIKTEVQLEELVECYFGKNTLTNNYIMYEDYKHYIEAGRLAFIAGANNLVLLLEKNGFCQLYYYLNDLGEGMSLPKENSIVIEILYRGEPDKPCQVIEYWERNSFVQHLCRDQMAGSIKKITFPENLTDKVQIKYANEFEEVEYAYQLIKNTFDAYTGDILTHEEVEGYAESECILLALMDGKPCGILQLEIKNNVSWLRHIAVDPSCRKQGIANALVSAWIKKTSQPSARYQLWVVQDNVPALNLYKNYGFVYVNKTTISMLKK